nr:phosphoribosyl-ATP diphosphatase [Anaerolineaceae bacterium]
MTEVLQHLESVIQDRKANPTPDSYTASLFSAGDNRVAQKLGEEATEVIVAALGQGRSAQINEFADLFYHALVLMAQLDIALDDVCAELERRHKPQ